MRVPPEVCQRVACGCVRPREQLWREPCRGKRVESHDFERFAPAGNGGFEFDHRCNRLDLPAQSDFAVEGFVHGAADAFDPYIGLTGEGAKSVLHFRQRRVIDQIDREAQRHAHSNCQYRQHAAAGACAQRRQRQCAQQRDHGAALCSPARVSRRMRCVVIAAVCE